MVAFCTTSAGDNIGFYLGRCGGQEMLERSARKLHLGPGPVQRGRDFVNRHGAMGVFCARFVAGLRLLNGLVAGSLRMSWPRFFLRPPGSGLLGRPDLLYWLLLWRPAALAYSSHGPHQPDIPRSGDRDGRVGSGPQTRATKGSMGRPDRRTAILWPDFKIASTWASRRQHQPAGPEGVTRDAAPDFKTIQVDVAGDQSGATVKIRLCPEFAESRPVTWQRGR
jgi:hypothetical protein